MIKIKIVITLAISIIFCVSIINPSTLFIKGSIIAIFLAILFTITIENKIYLSILLIIFPIHLQFLGTSSNFVIISLAFVLLIEGALKRNDNQKLRIITKNSIFWPSFMIIICYIYSYINADKYYKDIRELHFVMLISIICGIAFSYILITFIINKERLINIAKIFLYILIFNLIFAIVSLIFPKISVFITDMKLVQTGTVAQGIGEDFAFRLGAFNFRWEGYAEFLMMAIIFVFVYLNSKNVISIKNRILLIIILLISAIELLITNTRGAIISSLIGVATSLFVFSLKNVYKKILILLLSSFLFIIAIIFAEKSGYLRLENRFGIMGKTVMTPYGSMPAARAMTWRPAIDQIIADKFKGRGPSFIPLSSYEKYGNMLYPHNLLLMILITVGISGLLCYMWLIIRMIILYIKIKNLNDRLVFAIYSSLWLSIVYILIDEMKFDGLLRHPDSHFYLGWILFGIIFSVENVKKRFNA